MSKYTSEIEIETRVLEFAINKLIFHEKLLLAYFRVMQQNVDQLLQEYESVFSKGVGTLKGHKADLRVEEGCQPSFHKPCQVPYPLRPKVEAELTHLEKEGILSKVEYSEWATPIVPVV